jgi:transposase
MEPHRTAVAETPTTRPPVCRAQADPGPRRVDRYSVRAAQRHPVEHAAARDGLRVRDHVLAAARALATRRGLEAAPPGAARRITAARPIGFGPRGGRQCLTPRGARGKKTGPNPTDRRKAGSKHHVLTDAHGIPLVATLTAAHRHDVTQLLPLVDAMPTLRGRPGRPLRKPRLVQGDRGYDSQPHRDQLAQRGIASQLAKRGRAHGSRLGRTRWVVERTIAWLHRFRRLAVRYERRSCVHEAFLTLACSLVCWYYLRPVV